MQVYSFFIDENFNNQNLNKDRCEIVITKMIIPSLTADGQTSMGSGLNVAMDLIKRRKAQYKELGVPYHRPWIFMISDGAPNDDYIPSFHKVNQMQQQNKLDLWAVGVPGYDKELLTSITKRVIELDASLNFAGLFEWLSCSLSAKSRSKACEIIQFEMLPQGSRVVPNDWGY